MAERSSATRSHEHTIEIRTPVRFVWRALTDPKMLTRWFVEEAEIEPRKDGRFWVSWGAEGDGEARIDVWEPHKRLRLVYLPFEGAPPMPEGGAVVEEFTLEDRGDSTVLRLVHSGIPASPEWDGFFKGTDVGWEDYLEYLRDLLEVGDDEEFPEADAGTEFRSAGTSRRRKGDGKGD
ncbi:MAG: SRPBCC domain-containing protein [Candidatus Eisenbacteria bacterium]|nr:SRPBCC domain-containing protein [Candidatus Eisenbacteria bacterium]